MMHQSGKKKLNMKPHHRRSVLRNQMISLINHGYIKSTKPRIKELQRFAERLVTIARKGQDFNTIRRVNSFLPYDKVATRKLISQIAPKYVNRPGGYTRVISFGRRVSDTAPVARIEWV